MRVTEYFAHADGRFLTTRGFLKQRIGQIRGVADDEVAARRVYFQKLHPYHPVPSICPARGFQKAGEREKNARASVYAASFCSADTPF